MMKSVYKLGAATKKIKKAQIYILCNATIITNCVSVPICTKHCGKTDNVITNVKISEKYELS